MKNATELINILEDLKVMTGRMGSYELSTINLLIDELKKSPLFTLNDMELAFYKGSRILADNHSLDYLENFEKFMKNNYNIDKMG